MHLKRMKVVEKNKMTNKKENENGLCTLIVEAVEENLKKETIW